MNEHNINTTTAQPFSREWGLVAEGVAPKIQRNKDNTEGMLIGDRDYIARK